MGVFFDPETGKVGWASDTVYTSSDFDHGGLQGLGDDDHTQYHNDARALTWLGNRSLSDLATRTHALLTSLSADDHTQYALLAGRSGGQTLIGGTGAGDDLTLKGTSHTTRGSVITLDPVKVLDETQTFTAIPDPALDIGYGKTFTVNVLSGGAPAALRYNPTLVFQQQPSPFGMGSIFINQSTVKNSPGAAMSFPSVYTLVDQATYQADNADISSSALFQILLGPNFAGINGGTIRPGNTYGARIGVGYGTNSQGRDRYGVNVREATLTGNGYIRRQIGIDLDSLTVGTEANYAIRTGASGRVSFGVPVETTAVRIKSPNGTQFDFTTDDSGNLDTTGTEVAFDPMVSIDWSALYLASRLTYADTADVTLWEDCSGNFRDLTIGVAPDVPTMETSSVDLNSQPAVEFTSANFQSLQSRESVSISASLGYTICMVLSFKSVAAQQRFFGNNSGSNVRGAGISATPNWTTNMGTTAASGGTPATGTKYFVRVYATSSSHTIYVNEVSQATTATTAVNLNQIVLGSGRGNLGTSNYFDGYIAMAGVYTGDISADAQWTRFKTYLNSTYGFAL